MGDCVESWAPGGMGSCLSAPKRVQVGPGEVRDGKGRGGGRLADSGGNEREKANPSGDEAEKNRNEHRDDENLPDDTLGNEAAAPLWEEFEALGIHVRRAEPVFPPRPGYGADGTPCVVRANRFLGRLADEGLHQYDVTISPEPTSQGAYREVMTKLVSENQDTELGGRLPAYDDRGSLFTAGVLPFDTKEFEVTLSAGGSENQDTELGGRLPANDDRDSLSTARALPFDTKEFEVTLSAGGSENHDTELGGRLPAYDDRDSLSTAGARPFDTKEFEVTPSAGGDEKMDRKYKVVIKHAATINLLQLRMLLAGYPTDIPAQALLVLDSVLRDVVSNERNDMECAAIATKDRTLGADAWKGLYQSIRSKPETEKKEKRSKPETEKKEKRSKPKTESKQNCLSLIADVSSSVFVQPLLLIECVQKILNMDVVDRTLTKPEYDKLLKVLRGVRIEVTHLGDNTRRKHRIVDLSADPANDLSFQLRSKEKNISFQDSGATMTVVNFFKEIYGLDLKYKSLPCIIARGEQNPLYLPIEVCKIVPRPCYQKKLEASQVSTLRKSACIFPGPKQSHSKPEQSHPEPEQSHPEPEQSCHQTVDQEQYKRTKHANNFDIEVYDNLATVDARVLLPPNLKYHDSGSQKMEIPKNGYWTMKDKKVINGAKISNWACLNFCNGLPTKDIEEFCFKLAERSRIIGVEFANLNLPIFTARSDKVEDGIHKCYQEAKNMLKDQKIDLLLAILPYNKNDSLYGDIKRICETDIGLVSQCCRRSSVSTDNSQILSNIALKINAKAGGRNSVFHEVQKSLPVVSNKPTIIFGAHVSHPSKEYGPAAPSIASVVASQDWHEVSKYNNVVRAQGHTEEISGLEDIVKELLHAFAKEPNRKLQQLIFYRDGISKGRFKQVLEKEIPAIEKAWNALYDNEKPQITFIVVQKGHRLRLAPMDKYKLHSAMKEIVEPGTVVDSEICHPAEFDFFLCSHADVKGLRRPVKYLVLRDDNNFTADGLQTLTNNLCYTYTSRTQSVSIAPPVFYAQKLAHRALAYLGKVSDTESESNSGSAAAPVADPKQLPEIKNELKGSMFYC